MSKSTDQQVSLTKGEIRVGVSFNPSGKMEVDKVKQMAADLIDVIEQISQSTENAEAKRCFSIAQTDIETAAMYAVKGIIKK